MSLDWNIWNGIGKWPQWCCSTNNETANGCLLQFFLHLSIFVGACKVCTNEYSHAYNNFIPMFVFWRPVTIGCRCCYCRHSSRNPLHSVFSLQIEQLLSSCAEPSKILHEEKIGNKRKSWNTEKQICFQVNMYIYMQKYEATDKCFYQPSISGRWIKFATKSSCNNLHFKIYVHHNHHHYHHMNL